MKKKNRFHGKYYKFITKDKYVFSIIDSYINDIHQIQIITKDKSFPLITAKSNSFYEDYNFLIINIISPDIKLIGNLEITDPHPLTKPIMGPFLHLPLPCKHHIYSMFHKVKGDILIDNNKYELDYGYIEGDEGTSFPTQYIWYNSINKNYGLTLCIAKIKLGLIKFKGLLCIINCKDKEYRFTTYNHSKIKLMSKDKIIITKGKYKLEISLYYDENNSYKLNAPTDGCMNRYIKENIQVKSHFILSKGYNIIFEKYDELSSLEYMW